MPERPSASYFKTQSVVATAELARCGGCRRAATNNSDRVASTQRVGYKPAFAVHRIRRFAASHSLHRFNDSTPATVIALKPCRHLLIRTGMLAAKRRVGEQKNHPPLARHQQSFGNEAAPFDVLVL